MPRVDLPTGAQLDTLDTGSGEQAILLLHGLLGSASRHFPQIIDWLSPRYRLIGPTLRGYGESTPKPRDFPANFYQRDADDVLALLDALDVEQVHVLGYSDGGEVALCAAATAPERFLSVAVWGAVGYFGPAMRPVAQRMFPATWMTAEEQQANHITSPDAFALRWIRAMHQMIDSGGDISLSRAHHIAAPMLLMLGEQDTLNPVEYGQRLVERAQQGTLKTFACGHAIHDELWPQFKQTLTDWLP